MFQELRRLRLKLNLYYMMVFILIISAFIGFFYYNIFYSNRFITDRELKINAGMVNNLNVLPVLYDMPPPRDKDDEGQSSESMFKFILRDENLVITQASVQYQELFAGTEELARYCWNNQKETWDTLDLQGIQYRIYSVPFHSMEGSGVVQTYCNLTMIHKFVGRFAQLLISSGIFASALAALLGWWLAGRAMLPIKLAWQRQKEFIADVSHELRTPLTVIQSNLDVLVNDQNGSIKDNDQWLQNAYSETENMGKLMNNLLFLARVDAREIKFQHTEFDLSALLNRIYSQFAPWFQSRKLNFSANIETDVNMSGDEIRIKQMVSAFLDNAVKYTPEGGTVSLNMRKKTNAIEIEVADSGIGFDEAEKEKIFMRFYRIDKARSRKQGGTGLGLAITACIVKEHKGTIQVHSQPGKGSTFKVTFPKS